MRILLVVYDNDSYIHEFPQGLAYIAAVLIKAGHNVEIYNQDQHHYKDDHLRQYLDNNEYDVIGVGVIAGYYQYRKLLKLSEAINCSKNRPYFILGGHGPCPEPEYFLRKTKADAIIMGEGEETVVEFLNALSNQKPHENIKGIALRNGDSVKINERRAPINNVDSIPFPAYDLFPIDYYKLIRYPHAERNDYVMPVLSGRGCTFQCNFCYRMDKGFRPRRHDCIIEEIRLLKEKYGVTYIVFSDELLMSSIQRTMTLCEDIIKAKMGIKWACNGRLNYAKPEVLNMMKRAGCVFINYGIEAMDDIVLKNMNKALTVRQVISGIEATLKEGISPGFNIIYGNIGDDKETLNKGVEFLLKYDDGSQLRTIRPVTPYPGSPLYYYAIKKGLLKDVEDFYENKHINSDLLAVNFTQLSDDDFHRCLMEANIRLIRNYYNNKLELSVNEAKELYLNKNEKFRGFRQS